MSAAAAAWLWSSPTASTMWVADKDKAHASHLSGPAACPTQVHVRDICLMVGLSKLPSYIEVQLLGAL